MSSKLAFCVDYWWENQGAKGKGICCRSVLGNSEILGVGVAGIFAEEKQRASSPRDCRALSLDGHLTLALLCSPGSTGSSEVDHRPSLKKKFLNWLKDRETKPTSRASSLLSSAGLACEVTV